MAVTVQRASVEVFISFSCESGMDRRTTEQRSLEKHRESGRERGSMLSTDVVAERAADRGTVHVHELNVQAMIPRVRRVEVHPDQVLGAVPEPRNLVAEDLR